MFIRRVLTTYTVPKRYFASVDEQLMHYGKKKSNKVTLSSFLEAGMDLKGQTSAANLRQMMITQIASFLHRELQVRVAQRIVGKLVLFT